MTLWEATLSLINLIKLKIITLMNEVNSLTITLFRRSTTESNIQVFELLPADWLDVMVCATIVLC